MAHKIIDHMSWMANLLHQNPDNWSLELGEATVTSLTSGNEFVIGLSGGSKIIINSPFQIRGNAAARQVDPREESAGSVARELLYRSIQEAVVTLQGTLEIRITAENVPETMLSASSHSWKIYFSNGSACWSLPDSGLELFPP